MISAIFMNSLGCHWMPAKSIQRCAPLPICPTRITRISKPTPPAYATQDSRAITRMSIIAMPSIIASPKPNRMMCLLAYGSAAPPAAAYNAT